LRHKELLSALEERIMRRACRTGNLLACRHDESPCVCAAPVVI
jgi:hypothetical protein